MAFSFTQNRKTFYIVSLVLVIFSLLSPFLFRFNLGIDITGGIQIEYSVTGGSVDAVVEETKNTILQTVKAGLTEEQNTAVTDVLVYRVTGTDQFMVEAGINESVYRANGEADLDGIEAAKSAFVSGMAAEYAKYSNAKIEQIRYVNIGASFGDYIKKSAYITITLSVIVISLYIMYAFSGSIPGVSSWPFAFVTGLSLLHDVIISFGLYVLVGTVFPEFKIDIFFLTAMLTVLGYSINDSIVIMDRVRATLKNTTQKARPLAVVIDDAVHSTLRRSLFTSLTLVFVLVAMFLFGPESIAGFVLAMIFGAVIGTYSSIFLAAPMLVDLYGKNADKKKK